jgi:6-phosphogluconolactonase
MKKHLLFSILSLILPLFLAAQERLLYVGTYTSRGSEGIYAYRFNSRTGVMTRTDVTGGIENPSFLASSPDGKYLYAVAENPDGEVNAYRSDAKSGKLTFLNKQSSRGSWPCHLAVDKTGKTCIAGNYGSGNFSVFPVQADGSLGASRQTIQHEGSSVIKDRQEGPHVHCVGYVPNNDGLFVTDLGTDRIYGYNMDPATGRLWSAEPLYFEATPGAGPRHFVFHPNGRFVYAVMELNCTVNVLKFENGGLEKLQTISTLPEGYNEKNSCADIHVSPDGKFLYASNRGHNSIVAYSIDQKTGGLTLIDFYPTLGKAPRNFTLDPSGKFVLIANQDSDSVQIYKRDERSGKLKYHSKGADVSMPVCLLFRPE